MTAEDSVRGPLKEPPLKPNTTDEQDRVTAGQRRVNLVWEHTQAAIALVFAVGSMILYGVSMFQPSVKFPDSLIVIVTSIITAYFTRTNHTNTGGVGPKTPGQER